METIRQRKKRTQEARWRSMTPAQRLQQASAMTDFALELREAGLAYLGVSKPAKRARKAG